MNNRCEPPEELRGVDGWHWLTHPKWGEWPTRYSASCHAGVWPIWQCPDSNWTTPAAHREGWRYLATVATPAEVDALQAEASEWCQKAQLFEDRIHKLRAELAAARELLSQGLDLCVRARRMDQRAQELLDWQSRNPHITKSATLPLWAEEQYQTDLAEWENAARAALGDPA